jgi:hypothetical protein
MNGLELMREAAFADQISTVEELTQLKRAAEALAAPDYFDDLQATMTETNVPQDTNQLHQNRGNVDTAGPLATTVPSALN